MGRALIIGSALALLFTAVPLRADILEWQDSSGVHHYTNQLSSVPEEYRAEVATIARDWPRAEPPPEPIARAQGIPDEPEPTPQAPPAAPQDSGEMSAGTGTEKSGAPEGQPPQLAAVPPAAPAGPIMGEEQTVFGDFLPLGSRVGTARASNSVGGLTPFTAAPQRNSGGPSPIGAAGSPPIGAAGRSTMRIAGPPPSGATGRGH